MYILKGSLCQELVQVRLKFVKLHIHANVLCFLISTFFYNFVFMNVKKLQYIVCEMDTQEMHSITLQQLSCNR